MNKKTIRLTESDLHRIIKESVNRVLNEVSTNKRAAALVKANNQKFPDTKTMMKGNRVVDTNLEKQRKERQKDLFANSVARDVGKAIGRDRGERNAKSIAACQIAIKTLQKRIEDPNMGEERRKLAMDDIKRYKEQLKKLRSDNLGFKLSANNDGYHLSDDNGNVAYSNVDVNGFNYDDPKEANRASQMMDVTDRLMGYDDELNQGSKLDGRLDYLQRRKQNAANLEKYYKDKEDWEDRKWKAGNKMDAWKSKNPVSRMFSKKPEEFNEPEPRKPEWDKGGGGYYFLGKSDDYNDSIVKQDSLNNHYRLSNDKNKK